MDVTAVVTLRALVVMVVKTGVVIVNEVGVPETGPVTVDKLAEPSWLVVIIVPDASAALVGVAMLAETVTVIHTRVGMGVEIPKDVETVGNALLLVTLLLDSKMSYQGLCYRDRYIR